VLSKLYGVVAARRRNWYGRRPHLRRRLTRPVVSVGSLAVGGRGKTPVTALIAEMLRDAGERPAVLSRGYARRRHVDGVVVVRDRDRVLTTLEVAGDEPLMLAERLSGVSVLVSEDRYAAGCLAESELDATVHVLDDGFQYLTLDRDVDLLLVRPEDMREKTLPFGQLREVFETARVADAIVFDDVEGADIEELSRSFGVSPGFTMIRSIAPPRPFSNSGNVDPIGPDARVIAVAGIAAPERFIQSLKQTSFNVVDALPFKDHHQFTTTDVARITERIVATSAEWVFTTEKDAVRLTPFEPLPFRLATVPLAVTIEPADRFRTWLLRCIDVEEVRP
jgi:tetraacyldisaccharide 4'-kinase